MKVPCSIAELVSEFSGFNHTPDFKPVRSMTNCQRCENECHGCSKPNSGTSTPVRKNSQERKHSVMITVGAEEVPTVSTTPPNGRTCPDHHRYSKHNDSLPCIPCISKVASSSSLNDKLMKLKRSGSNSSVSSIKEEHDAKTEEPRKSSVTSYRLI